MPATRATTVQQRQEMVRLAESDLAAAAIGELLHLSVWTVRKWLRQNARGGLAGLATRLGRPRRGPLGNISALGRYLALRLKRQHPGWGAAYVVKQMSQAANLQGQTLPSATSVWRYWRSFEDRLCAARPRPEPKPEASGSVHGVWQLDFKESVAVAGVGPTTFTQARDLVGRATVLHRVHPAWEPEQRIVKLDTAQVQADCRIAFTQWGLPDAIRTDRASLFRDREDVPFPARLILWWVGLGITPQLIRRGRPQDNGSVERAHRTLVERTLDGQTFVDSDALQRQVDADWHELNFECPSRAQGCHGQPPALAHPELSVPRRPYRPEWEMRLFDLGRVATTLAGSSWVRGASTTGQVQLGGFVYGLSMRWAGQTARIQFDPSDWCFRFSQLRPSGPAGQALPMLDPITRPAQGLSAAELIGPIDLALAQPVRQLSLPFLGVLPEATARA